MDHLSMAEMALEVHDRILKILTDFGEIPMSVQADIDQVLTMAVIAPEALMGEGR